jgi:3',5'-cyclic AMP phosphodiesterase CpdA
MLPNMDTNPSQLPQVSRRTLLGTAAGLSAGLLMTGLAARAASPFATPLASPASKPKRALRVVHMTDTHIQPELAANEGVRACLKHIAAMKEPADLILTGGDTIMDSFEEGHERTKALWDLWGATLKDAHQAPMLSALGNHDIWGWNKGKSKTTGDEKGWGKAWACEQFQRDKPYTSKDQGGWHFIVLDSIREDKNDPNGYEAFLDDEQFDWLAKDLAATTKPTLILSHAPILSVTPLEGLKTNATGDRVLAGGKMHTDFPKLSALFQKHKHVKACVAGHIHLLDRVEYNGVKYFCNGAVSGGWWKGPNRTCEPGYAVLDLMDDGTLTNEYVEYGWVARKG